MNKYLEKIAEIHYFEDGVTYDDQKHDLKISNSYMNNHLKKKDTLQRSIVGGMYGSIGGTFGGVYAGMEAEAATAKNYRPVLKYDPYLKAMITDHIHTSPKYPTASKIVNKIGRKPIIAAGALLGGLAVGGLGYAISGLRPTDKPRLKDSEIIRLERKYDDKINEIEGW